MLTRRCTQRQFLMRPDDEINNAFLYCVIEAAQKFGISVMLPQMMSNHHHTVIYDPHGYAAEFMERFHNQLAKCPTCCVDRWENMLSSEPPCVVEARGGRATWSRSWCTRRPTR